MGPTQLIRTDTQQVDTVQSFCQQIEFLAAVVMVCSRFFFKKDNSVLFSSIIPMPE